MASNMGTFETTISISIADLATVAHMESSCGDYQSRTDNFERQQNGDCLRTGPLGLDLVNTTKRESLKQMS